jgi:hypothetical protein
MCTVLLPPGINRIAVNKIRQIPQPLRFITNVMQAASTVTSLLQTLSYYTGVPDLYITNLHNYVTPGDTLKINYSTYSTASIPLSSMWLARVYDLEVNIFFIARHTKDFSFTWHNHVSNFITKHDPYIYIYIYIYIYMSRRNNTSWTRLASSSNLKLKVFLFN